MDWVVKRGNEVCVCVFVCVCVCVCEWVELLVFLTHLRGTGIISLIS